MVHIEFQKCDGDDNDFRFPASFSLSQKSPTEIKNASEFSYKYYLNFQDVSITKKSTEKYHLWHRGIVKSIDNENQLCTVKLEHGVKTGEKRKMGSDEINVRIEDIFPLTSKYKI